MRVESIRFGGFEAPEETVLEFPAGVFGFPQLRRGCLLPHAEVSGLRWLQSLDDPRLLFLSVEPYLVFLDYEVELSDSQAAALDLSAPEEAAVLTLVTVCPDARAVTANLLAPIVINMRTRQARQVLLEAEGYGTRHVIEAGLRGGPNARTDA